MHKGVLNHNEYNEFFIITNPEQVISTLLNSKVQHFQGFCVIPWFLPSLLHVTTSHLQHPEVGKDELHLVSFFFFFLISKVGKTLQKQPSVLPCLYYCSGLYHVVHP